MATNEYYMPPDELYSQSQDLTSWDAEPKTPPPQDNPEEDPDRATPTEEPEPPAPENDSPPPENLTPAAASCCAPPAPELPPNEVRNPPSVSFGSCGGFGFFTPYQEKPKKDKFVPAILKPALVPASPPIRMPLKENINLLNTQPEPRKRKQQF